MEAQPSQVMLRSEDRDGKEVLQAAFTEAESFRNIAVAYLQKKWGNTQTKQTHERNYELPSYSERQADYNGSLRTIEEIITEVFGVSVRNITSKQLAEAAKKTTA